MPIPRCCPAHLDWRTLARHLFADFADVPIQEIFEALRQAKHAGEYFELSAADALYCAEVMVRYRVLVDTGRPTTLPPDMTRPISVVRIALPHQSSLRAGVH
jgi:hypothetical protein